MASQPVDLRQLAQERLQNRGQGGNSGGSSGNARVVAVRAERGGEPAVAPYCLGIGFLVTLGVLLIAAVVSMAVVHPTEYGLVFNRFTQSVQAEVKLPGRYFIGPWSSMIIYPAVAQTVQYSNSSTATRAPLRARTDDGLDLTLMIAFQFKLRASAIYRLYTDFRDTWEAFIERQAIDQITRDASKFSARRYWEERPQITRSIHAGLEQLFQDRMDITDVQLIQSILPAAFEKTITDTQVQRQIQKTRQAEQQAAVIRAEIDVMLAEYEKQKQITLNTATANANLLIKTAQANAQKSRIDVENYAVELIKKQMPLTASGVIAYQKGIAYQNLDNAQMMFGIDQTAVLTKPAPHAAGTEAVCDGHTPEPEDLTSAQAQVAGVSLQSAINSPK